MDRVPVETETTEVEPTPPTNWEGAMGVMDDLNFHRMADSLEISYDDRKITHVQEKIQLLSEWAKEITKSDDSYTKLLEIKGLAKRLGIPSKGKDLVTKLNLYIKLDQNRKQIEQRMELI